MKLSNNLIVCIDIHSIIKKVHALNRESERLKKVISNLAKVGVKISKTKSRLEVLQSVNQLSSVIKS